MNVESVLSLNIYTWLIYVFKYVKSKFRDSDDDMPVRDTILGEDNVPRQLDKCDEDKSDSSFSESDNERLRFNYIVK